MDASFSSTSTSNPSDSPKTNSLPNSSNSNMSTPVPEPRNPESQYSDTKAPENPSKEPDPDQPNNEDEAEEEEGECGFCLFMKAGGCRESFIAWENCIEEAEKNKEDIVDKCFEVTGALKRCMEAHRDYYEPILRAEKAAEEEAVKELNAEKAAQYSEKNADSKDKDSEGLERN